jgi:hypothetical protein
MTPNGQQTKSQKLTELSTQAHGMRQPSQTQTCGQTTQAWLPKGGAAVVEREVVPLVQGWQAQALHFAQGWKAQALAERLHAA